MSGSRVSPTMIVLEKCPVAADNRRVTYRSNAIQLHQRAGVGSVLNTDHANKVLQTTQAMICYVAQTDEHPKTVYIE